MPIIYSVGRAVSIIFLLLLIGAFAPAAGAVDTAAQAPGAADPNPLVGQNWWGGQRNWLPAWRDVRRLRRGGHRRKAALVQKLAEQPQFKWFGRWSGYGNPRREVRKSLKAMDGAAPNSVPLMVTMRHEGQQCSPSYLGGGRRADRVYRQWIRGFARGIGNRRVVIGFEPDALGTTTCLAKHRRKARFQTLRYGVDVLSKLPNATVYIDAGASDWQGVPTMARKLRRVGVHKVRGFMLNATHQAWTAGSITYGRRLSRALGGKHFIVNTSHNGNGPVHRKVWVSRTRNIWRIDTEWCNPPNAAAGRPPTTRTGAPLVDTFMWVERPGYSNGACNGGPARVGAWWRERALQMARRADW